MRLRWTVQTFLLAFVVGLVGGCGDDDGGGGVVAPTAAELAGAYELVSIQFLPNPAVGPPIATGTLVLTEIIYEVSITIAVPGQETEEIEDRGTYEISDENWSQKSAVIKDAPQSTGTFTFDGQRLSVMVTSPAEITTIWDRTS